jgi:cysteine desulfurase/selenocysteine lyase
MSFSAVLLKQFPIFSRKHDRALHYLDNAAMAQVCNAAMDASTLFEMASRANVHRGNYTLAEEADVAYERARVQVARFVNAEFASEIVFTAGTTAAINLLALSWETLLVPGDEIAISVAEHHSNLVPWQLLCKRRGILLRFIPLMPSGALDLSHLDKFITSRCRLVAVTACSNVTGVITDLAPLVHAARKVDAKILVDGAQLVQHGPVDVQALGVDYFVFSGHKCFGPNGVGVLWGRLEALAALPAIIAGGGAVTRVSCTETFFDDSPKRFEPGTPPIAQAIGLGAATEWMMTLPWPRIIQEENRLTRRLCDGLASIRGIQMLGCTDPEIQSPIVSFALAGVHPHDICQVLDMHGVAVRGGYHCAQPLFHFFGLDGATRASIALYNNEHNIDTLLVGVDDATRRLR